MGGWVGGTHLGRIEGGSWDKLGDDRGSSLLLLSGNSSFCVVFLLWGVVEDAMWEGRWMGGFVGGWVGGWEMWVGGWVLTLSGIVFLCRSLACLSGWDRGGPTAP